VHTGADQLCSETRADKADKGLSSEQFVEALIRLSCLLHKDADTVTRLTCVLDQLMDKASSSSVDDFKAAVYSSKVCDKASSSSVDDFKAAVYSSKVCDK